MTAGVLVFLYLFWQLWYNDMVVRAQQDGAGQSLIQQWEQNPVPEPVGTDPVIPERPGDGEVFALLKIPRFGEDYAVQIGGGVSKARTLNPIGLGHYDSTQLPGEPGNFALAGHRNTYGAPLKEMTTLRVGDEINVETPAGTFTYRFRNSEYVLPSGSGVLKPVPQADTVETSDSLITLTSCNPQMSTAERIIGYGVFEKWTPRAASGTDTQ